MKYIRNYMDEEWRVVRPVRAVLCSCGRLVMASAFSPDGMPCACRVVTRRG